MCECMYVCLHVCIFMHLCMICVRVILSVVSSLCWCFSISLQSVHTSTGPRFVRSVQDVPDGRSADHAFDLEGGAAAQERTPKSTPRSTRAAAPPSPHTEGPADPHSLVVKEGRTGSPLLSPTDADGNANNTDHDSNNNDDDEDYHAPAAAVRAERTQKRRREQVRSSRRPADVVRDAALLPLGEESKQSGDLSAPYDTRLRTHAQAGQGAAVQLGHACMADTHRGEYVPRKAHAGYLNTLAAPAESVIANPAGEQSVSHKPAGPSSSTSPSPTNSVASPRERREQLKSLHSGSSDFGPAGSTSKRSASKRSRASTDASRPGEPSSLLNPQLQQQLQQRQQQQMPGGPDAAGAADTSLPSQQEETRSAFLSPHPPGHPALSVQFHDMLHTSPIGPPLARRVQPHVGDPRDAPSRTAMAGVFAPLSSKSSRTAPPSSKSSRAALLGQAASARPVATSTSLDTLASTVGSSAPMPPSPVSLGALPPGLLAASALPASMTNSLVSLSPTVGLSPMQAMAHAATAYHPLSYVFYPHLPQPLYGGMQLTQTLPPSLYPSMLDWLRMGLSPAANPALVPPPAPLPVSMSAPASSSYPYWIHPNNTSA
jgi:hypothetical protein